MKVMTKKQLRLQLEMERDFFISFLKEICKSPACPFRWEEIKNRKLLFPFEVSYILGAC